MSRKIALLTLLIAIMAIFCHCDSGDNELIEYDGRLLTVDEIKAMMKESIETEPDPTIRLVCFDGEVEEEARVYWTSGGSVWHTRLMCGYLSKEGDIYYGTKEQAISEKKERCCSACEKYEK